MATRVPIQSAKKPYAAFPPYMKFDQNWSTEFRLYYFESVDGRCWTIAILIHREYWVVSFDIKFTSQGFWECLLTSPGLLRDSTCVLKAKPGKLDIKRCKPGILFISLPSFTLQTSDYDIIFYFCVDSVLLGCHSKSATSSWSDKGTCREIDIIYKATWNVAVNVAVNMNGNW